MKVIVFLFISSFLICAQPSYKIWSVVNSTNIDEGDTVTFDIGLSGSGIIFSKYLKFTLYGDATSKIFIKGVINPLEILVLKFPPPFQEKVDSLFLSEDSVTLKADNSRITINKHFSIVPENSGDNTIKVIATYSADGKSWNTEEAFINFHVNTWYEKWETPLVIFGFIFAVIGLIATIISIIDFCMNKKSLSFQKQNMSNKKYGKQK